jgi:hypothetical protein
MHPLKRLIVEDEGLEFVECSLVGLVVLLAAVHLWGGPGEWSNALARLRDSFARSWLR